MSEFISAKLAEIQLEKESNETPTTFKRNPSEAWLKRKAEQEEAVRKIEERRRGTR